MTVSKSSPESGLELDRKQLGSSRLGAAVFFMLIVATFAAFFIAQRLKHTPTPVEKLIIDPAFHPSGGGVPRVEAISLELAQPGGVTVTVNKPNGQIVTTLLTAAKRWNAHEPLAITWNGRLNDGRGALAPKGEYFVHIGLQHEQVLRSPSPFLLIR